MSEWLGKPRIEIEDIKKSQPSLVKYFPILSNYFVDDQKMRVTILLEHDDVPKFRAAVEKTFGFFGPGAVKEAGKRALADWLEKNS